jgi:hypothetical protein
METIHDVGSVRIRVDEEIDKSWKSCKKEFYGLVL